MKIGYFKAAVGDGYDVRGTLESCLKDSENEILFNSWMSIGDALGDLNY